MLEKEGKYIYKLNERVYDVKSFSKAFNEWKSLLKNNKTYGFISGENHNIGNISHTVKDPVINNDIVEFDYKVIDTPRGKCLGEFIDMAAEGLSINPRMIGRYNPETNKYEIQQILSFDVNYKI